MTQRPSTAERLKIVLWPVVTVLAFVFSIVLVSATRQILALIGVDSMAGGTVAMLTISVIIYILTLLVALYLAKLVKDPVRRVDMGLVWPTWRDIGVAIASFVMYVIVGSLVILTVQKLLPWFPLEQPQDLGFSDVYGIERGLAFVVLVIVAPVVEELIFRGILYGKLRSSGVRIAISVLMTSLLFALAHGQLNVGLDVFVLSIFLCLVREYTKGIGAPILIHMMKNGLAFYMLFVAGQSLS